MAKAPTKSTQQKTPSSSQEQEQEPLVKTHFVPPVKINTEYRSKITTKLIHSIEELKQALKSNTVVAWDTETTGLNPERSEIVGFSFSYDGKEAYYCPVKHVDIALGKESLSLFIESLKTSPCSLLYNARFDIRVMEYSGFDMSFMYPKDPSTGQSSPRFIDVMNSVWLSDTNFPLPSLKASTLHFLGYQPPKFLETLGEAESFQYLTADKAYDYAALDAANTYNLALVTMRYHKEAGLAANLDTATIYIIGQLEKTPIKMDTQYLKDLRDRTYQDVLDLEKRIYSYAGSSFKIGSNRELTKVFESLGIDTGERTKAHDMKTGIDLLQSYLRDHPDTPIITDLIQYKEKFKFYNSYLKTLVDVAENQEEYPPRFNYKLQAVPTSRLACGKDGKNTYFAPLNLQSIPKPQSNKSFGRPATQEEIDRHEDLLGWVFSPDHPEWSPGKCVEGMCPDDNVRRAFLPEHPENGDYVVSVDMCAEELRVVTNLFSEQSWARVINAGGDLHHANSDAIFGAENYTKETRKMAKAAAFGILYGQEYRGFQQHFPSMTLDEAKDFMVKFKKTIPSIVQGQQRMIRDAKRTGIIYSYFGHPRRVKQYFSSTNFRDVAFGERTVKNNPIQSTSADVLKIELIRLWDNLFTKYPQVKFICTIHDEVNYSVPRSLAAEVIPIILKCMTVKMPNWIVPLDCSLSVGSTLGGLIPFKYDFATKTFTPEWEEYKAKTVVVEEPKEVSETLSTKDDIEEIDSLMFDLN